jgi:hypothetical protein
MDDGVGVGRREQRIGSRAAGGKSGPGLEGVDSGSTQPRDGRSRRGRGCDVRLVLIGGSTRESLTVANLGVKCCARR